MLAFATVYERILYPNVLIRFNLCLKMAFSVLTAAFISIYSAVGYLTSSTSYFPPFLAAFFSSFFGGAPFPPFLFLSSTTSSYRFKIRTASEMILSNFGHKFSLKPSRDA